MRYSNKKHESGFTILEILLTLGILTSVLLLITKLFEESARSALYSKNAIYYNTVMDAAFDMVDTMGEFNVIFDLINANGGAMEVPLTGSAASVGVNPFNITVQDGAPPLNILPSTIFINTAAQEITPLGATPTVLFQIINNPPGSPLERRIGIFVAGLERLREKELRAAASAIGAGGGFISAIEERAGQCLAAGCTSTIRSIYNDWRMDAGIFAGERFGMTLAANLPSAADGGYLLSFRYVNESDIAGDYLYRLPQLANPELNSMNTDIVMSGNNLVGVDNIMMPQGMTIDRDTVIFAKGSIFTDGRLDMVGGDMVVDGDAQAGQLNVGPGYSDAGFAVIPPRNQIFVDDTVTANNTAVTNGFIADTGTLDNLSTYTLRVNNADIDVVSADGGGIFSTTSETTNLRVNGLARTQTARSTTTFEVFTGPSTAQDVISGGNTTFNSNVKTSSMRTNTVGIGNLEQCLAGC